MSTQTNAVPAVIKRKKVIAGGGHHGGAWKVAYADFVTAMMAFFMLMWLLNATTEKQRKGIADYFSPDVPINRISGGGDGAFGGSSVFSQDTLAYEGSGSRRQRARAEYRAKGDVGVEKDAESEALERVRNALEARSGDSLSRETLLRHVATRVTDEGLIVEIFDREEARLFKADTVEAEPVLDEIVTLIAEIFGMAENSVAINGHVHSYPVVLADSPIWDLSAARAARVRAMLEAKGVPAGRLQRIAGFADRKPVAQPPGNPRNNRIELILLRTKT